MGATTEQGSGNTRFHRCQGNPIIPNHRCPYACIHHDTPVDGHDERMPKIISFMKACDGHTQRQFFSYIQACIDFQILGISESRLKTDISTTTNIQLPGFTLSTCQPSLQMMVPYFTLETL